MYMKTAKSNQTVHNGFGQFPKIVQLRTRHSRHYLQFHILSLLPMTVQTSLSLLKDNATSCNPALPSGHGQCNVLQSSPTSGFFSLSLYYSTSLCRTQISSFFYVLAQTQIHDNSKPKCTQQHFKYPSLCTFAT